MSSVLFSRGINTQIGGKRKADEITRDLESIKGQIATAVSMSTSNREVVAKSTALIAELEAKITGLQEIIEALQTKVTALEERKDKEKEKGKKAHD